MRWKSFFPKFSHKVTLYVSLFIPPTKLPVGLPDWVEATQADCVHAR